MPQRSLSKETSDALVRLSGRVAHDFNNVLTVIRGYCVLGLQKMAADDPARPRLEAIHAVAQQAIHVTSQLLAFGRRQPFVPEVLDLRMHLLGQAEMIQQLLGDDIALEMDLGEADLPVHADRHCFDQVMANLALNAREAMRGRGKLTIQAEEQVLGASPAKGLELSPGRHVVLTVRDNGCGMAPEVLDRVFEPFFSTKENAAGVGFGLPSAYGIVKQAHGDIVIESAPGKGTAVRIFLPWCDKVEPGHPLHRAHPLLAGRRRTVLIVENREPLRRMIAEVLAAHGFIVIEAGDGQEALHFCESQPGRIDLVFTDIVMPRMDGLELAQRIGKLRPRTRILFTSGYALNEALQAKISRDEAHFLAKPYDVPDVVRKIHEVLGA